MPTIKLLKSKRDNVRTVRKKQYQDIYQNKRWKKLREWKLMNNPLCERCLENGRNTTAFEVHHKIPFETGRTPEEIETLAFDYDNLKSVCDPCHDAEHKKLNKK